VAGWMMSTNDKPDNGRANDVNKWQTRQWQGECWQQFDALKQSCYHLQVFKKIAF